MKTAAKWLVACAMGLALSAHADPGYRLVPAYADDARNTIDYRTWTVSLSDTPQMGWSGGGVGLGLTGRWYSELNSSFSGSNQAVARPKTLNWQNNFLVAQGPYDINVALHTNLASSPMGTDRNTLAFGPMLQTELGRIQLNTNLIFERPLGLDAGQPTQLKYQWQTQYRWRPALQFGLQGFGELGDWNHWADSGQQSHRWGPTLSGGWALTDNQRLEYQATYLRGKIYGLQGDVLSLRLQYLY